MKHFLDYSLGFFRNHYKTGLYIILIVIAFFLFSEVGFATGGQQHPGVGDAATASKAVEVIQGILQIVSALLGTVTAFVSLFLSPGWTSGQIFNMQVHLREIWILVSNVVYFLFALILIAIAFMNIIGKGDNKWELKAALPRFIIGILIVPFSWFFVQFIVSVSAILTVGVLTLPYDTFREYDFYTALEQNASEGEENDICIHPVVNLGTSSGDGENTNKLDCEKYGSIFSIISNGNSIFGIVSIYTYGVMSPEKLDELRSETLSADTGTIAGVADLLVKVAFDLVFIVIYFILMAALFLALFVRGVWLWIYMMLSPAFGLLYFFEKGSDGVGGGETKFSIKEFISLALVPVYVSAALSFGLLFIFVATHGIENDEQEGQSISIDSTTEGEETITLLGDYNFTIRGFQGSGPVGIVAGAGSALGSIIVQLFGLVILWIAVMAALKQSETTGKIIAPIEQFGTSVGKLVASSPMYAPILPTGSGGLSATALGSAGSSLKTAIEGEQTSRGSQFGQDTAKRFGFGDNDSSNLKTAMSSYPSLSGENTEASVQKGAFKTLFNNVDNEKLSSNKRLKEEFVDYLREIFGEKAISEDIRKKILNSSQGDLPTNIKVALTAISANGGGEAVKHVFGNTNPSLSEVQKVLRASKEDSNDSTSDNSSNNTSDTNTKNKDYREEKTDDSGNTSNDTSDDNKKNNDSDENNNDNADVGGDGGE